MTDARDLTTAAAKAATRQKVARLAFWSIVVAGVVLALKVVAWYITGSVALYSDAAESIVNVIASAAAFWAIQVSYKPADQDHPFGHHKAEYFSAVLEGVLIVVAALLILNEVWRSWQHPAPLEQPWKGLAVNGVATIINAIWAWILISSGRSAKSPALVADGQRHLAHPHLLDGHAPRARLGSRRARLAGCGRARSRLRRGRRGARRRRDQSLPVQGPIAR